MKTLYISDLDGTLLNSNERVSEYTVSIINRFIEKGAAFTYATARSYVTASQVARELNINLPVIYYNGAYIRDNINKNILLSYSFSKEEIEYISSVLSSHNVYPIAYGHRDGVERFSYIEEYKTPAMETFLNCRIGDPRRHVANTKEELYHGDIFYFACMDIKETLSPINDIFINDGRFYLVYHTDIYDGSQWFEILPAGATKANAAMTLKKMLGCDKIVAFGDSRNDICLFSVADECYATENAVPELKRKATAVIGNNNMDGVAKWIESNAF